PLPSVRRAARVRDGSRQRGGAARGARRRDRALVRRDVGEEPARVAHDQGVDERGGRRPRRPPATRGRRDVALLPEGGSTRRVRGVRRQAQARLRQVAQASVNKWVAGARPRTLPAAIVPVLVGTACARGEVPIVWWRAVAALVVALAIQVGTNYANDY